LDHLQIFFLKPTVQGKGDLLRSFKLQSINASAIHVQHNSGRGLSGRLPRH